MTRVALWACLVAIVVAGVETISSVATAVLVRRGHMAELGRLGDDDVTRMLRVQSTEFGWIPMLQAREPGFMLPARHDPAFAGGIPCASVYGESFAFGTPVADDATFPHHLAVALRCRVTNFGVPGYGSDQAFLLYRAQRDVDRAPVVILVHVTENVLRNVNQYRELLYPGGGFGFKPRFRVDERGKLKRVPLPVRSLSTFRAMERAPELVLAWDAFVSRPRRNFPYTPKLVRWVADGPVVRDKLFDEPWHLPYYRADHPAGGLDVTTAILSTFARDAVRRGRRPLVVVLPTSLDLIHARRRGRWAAAPLIRALAAAHVPTLDVGPAFLSRLGARESTSLYDAGRYGHLTPEGYQWLADAVRAAVETP